jgi:GNAT superfamily N-acetyltransferase
MIKIIYNSELALKEFIYKCDRRHLDFFEYNFIKDEDIKEYYGNKILKTFEHPDSLNLIILKNNTPLGLLNVIRDFFDSDMLGYNCYKISDLAILSYSHSEIFEITKNMISELESYLKKKHHQFYVSISLNNNLFNSNFIFNSLLVNGFFYIQTLLTFVLISSKNKLILRKSKQPILIRKVKSTDVESVAALAQKSFKYSRFHLDPFLDYKKTNLLLKTSAENSILKHFVDIMYVAEYDEKIVGYYSAKKRIIPEFERTFGEATISAVDEDYRGMGIFSLLNESIINWFKINTDFAEMGTYLINYPVHKTWINCNLSLIRGVHQFSKLYLRS